MFVNYSICAVNCKRLREVDAGRGGVGITATAVKSRAKHAAVAQAHGVRTKQ